MWNGIIRTLSRRAGKLRRSIVQQTRISPLLKSVAANAVVLEIGGGYNPRYRKADRPNVYHLDHCSTEELRAKYAANPGTAHQVGDIQEVDFVFTGTPIETLIPPTLKFDVIYGSHVLEHQVDLIGHFQSLEKVLKPGGRVIEVIPDLRACFDALRYPSVTSDALLVHMKRAPIHQGKQVFDSVALEIDKNQGHRMRGADFDGVRFSSSLRAAHDAMLAADLPGQRYADTHAWVFVPDSFRLLMIELRLLGLIQLEPTYVSPQYGNQFCAVLARAEPALAEMTPRVLLALEKERFALAKRLRV